MGVGCFGSYTTNGKLTDCNRLAPVVPSRGLGVEKGNRRRRAPERVSRVPRLITSLGMLAGSLARALRSVPTGCTLLSETCLLSRRNACFCRRSAQACSVGGGHGQRWQRVRRGGG